MSEDAKVEAKRLIEELVAVPETEAREDEIFARLNEICPDPEWADYIFWGDGKFERSDGSVDIPKVIEKVFAYKPILL